MAHAVEMTFEYPAQYEIVLHERIPRELGLPVYGLPAATPVDPQQELAAAPIVEIRPVKATPWIGVFYAPHDYPSPPAAKDQLVGMPDEISICRVAGDAYTVRTDDPSAGSQIPAYPVTDVVAIHESRLVLFADFTNLVAWGADGLAWDSGRLVLDDLKLERLERGVAYCSGFFGNGNASFTVDLETGRAFGRPWNPEEMDVGRR